MPIYKGSRYTDTPLYRRDGGNVFEIRRRREFNLENAEIHVFIQGETLDELAYEYYGDTQLWWVIMEANPEYDFEFEIPYGAELNIPSQREVRRLFNG